MGRRKGPGAGGAADDLSVLPPAGRAMIYEFLSYMLTKSPDEAMIAHLTSEEQISRIEALEGAVAGDRRMEELGMSLGSVAAALRSLRDRGPDAITRFQDEHVRMLRGIRKGSGPPPPYESVYRSGQMMSDHASDVQASYQRAGLEVLGGEPPDHIGFELAFMAFLCRREGECRESGNGAEAARLASLQDAFLTDHVLAWIPMFCQSALASGSEFYRPALQLTMAWLRLEERNADDRKST